MNYYHVKVVLKDKPFVQGVREFESEDLEQVY